MFSKSALMMPAAWPDVAAVLIFRLDRTRAVLWTLSAGYLLLPPVALSVPLLRQMNKTSIAALAATAGAVMLRQHSPLPKQRAERGVMFLAGLTVLHGWLGAGALAGLAARGTTASAATMDTGLMPASMRQPRLRSILR